MSMFSSKGARDQGITGPSRTITPSNRITAPSPRIDTIVSRTVHVATVCGTLMLKYSFTSQKPPSLTWLAMSEPAPIATTSRSLLTPGMAATIGVMMLAAVTQATVADPTETRSSAAMTQPSTSGDSRSPLIDCAIAVSTPAASSTRPKPPPAPTTSSTPATAGIDSSAKRSRRSRSKPHAVPNV